MFLRVLVLMAFSVIAAFAADVTGAWSGQMGGPNGDGFQISFTFKQDGAKLTGSVAGPQGDPMPIADGKVDGDKVSFTVSFNGMVIKHEGTVAGDEMKLTSKADQGDFPGGEMTLKRAK
ncbi:MAG: hypothetical protein ABJC09_16240 [Terriglobia bacterium]